MKTICFEASKNSQDDSWGSGTRACGVVLDDIKLSETFGDSSSSSRGSCGKPQQHSLSILD